jgi:DNA-binding MltR family transcriptional regulator
VLVPLLRREAETVDLTIRLVSEHALTRVHRKIFKEVHGRLFEIWEKYEDDDMTTTQLLRACSHIIGLGPSTTQDDIHDEDF